MWANSCFIIWRCSDFGYMPFDIWTRVVSLTHWHLLSICFFLIGCVWCGEGLFRSFLGFLFVWLPLVRVEASLYFLPFPEFSFIYYYICKKSKISVLKVEMEYFLGTDKILTLTKTIHTDWRHGRSDNFFFFFINYLSWPWHLVPRQ